MIGVTKSDRTESVPLLVDVSTPSATTPLDQPTHLESSAPSSSKNTLRIAGLALGGVGVVGVALGTVFGIRVKSKETDSEAHCSPDDLSRCDHEGKVLLDQGKTAATWANVGFIGGGAAIAGGVALLIAGGISQSPGTEPKSAHATRLVPVLGPRDARILVEGAF